MACQVCSTPFPRRSKHCDVSVLSPEGRIRGFSSTPVTLQTRRLLVEISSHGAAGPWTEIARHITSGGLDWRTHVITAAELSAAGVVMTANMQLRFTANDADRQSIVEAGLDAFKVFEITCGPAFPLGDLNCDGALNGADIDPFFLALGDPAAYAIAFPNCDIMNGDVNRDGAVNGADIDVFFECLGAGVCP